LWLRADLEDTENDEWESFEDESQAEFINDIAEMQKVLDEMDSGERLYSGSKFSKEVACAMLLKLTCNAQIPQRHANDMFQCFRTLLPEGNTLPCTVKEALSLLTAARQSFKVVHACSNDCCTYEGQLRDAVACPACDKPRYKGDGTGRKPVKVVYRWSVARQVASLFSTPEKADMMKAHAKLRSRDGVVRSIFGKLEDQIVGA
jgi:hypothetical protein